MPIFGPDAEIAGQSIIFLGIGILLVGLIGVAIFPLVHNRAVRLTMRRLDEATPMSMKEIQADKDHLRAEFAVSTRRLETSIADLKGKTHAQNAALGQKSALIQRMRDELDARAMRIVALEEREAQLEAREKSLFDQLRASKDEASRMIDAVQTAERTASEMQAEQRELESVFEEQARLVQSQRLEIIALQTEIETIRDRVYEVANYVKDAESRSTRDWVEFRNAGTAHSRKGGNGVFDTGDSVRSSGTVRNGASAAASTPTSD